MEATKKIIKLLATELNCKPSEIDQDDWEFLTDEEADQRAKDCISESVWAFNTSFLMAHAKDNISESCFNALKEQYESGNEAIKELIADFDHFVDDAMNCDGRGHFINSYDGQEYELYDGKQYIYAYRIN